MSTRTVAVLAIVAVVLVAPIRRASAQPAEAEGAEPEGGVAKAAADADAKERARQKFRAGVDAFSQGRYKDAVDLFLQADAIVPSDAFAYNAALAYDKMGDHEHALRWSREYLRRAPEAADRLAVEESIRGHEQHLKSKGIQQVTVLSTPSGARLLIDGEAVGVTPWTGELAPGAHKASLQLSGYSAAEQDFELTPDRSIDVPVDLVAAPLEAPKPGPVGPSGPVDSGPPAWLFPVSLVGLGLGAAGLAAAGALEALRADEEQQAFDAPVQLDAVEHLDKAGDFETGARVLVGVGGALFLAGAVMLIVDLTSGEEEGASARLRFGCDGGGCGPSLQGSF